MPLPLVYHDDYSPPFPANHRFPMEKFRLLHDHLIASGVTSASELLRPELCPPAILQLAHCPDYIARFLAGDLGHAEQRRLGLPWSSALARRTVRAVGGSLLAAEQALFDAGTSVSELMEIAAGGAAEWIRRIAAGRAVTVLCGPGNNGGDGYVIARRLREAGNAVAVIAPLDPATDAAKEARRRWDGPVSTASGAGADVFVDCLFGSGLARPLIAEHALLLRDLAARPSAAVRVSRWPTG